MIGYEGLGNHGQYYSPESNGAMHTSACPHNLCEPSRHFREFRRRSALRWNVRRATFLSQASEQDFAEPQRSARDLTLQNAARAVRLWKRDDAAPLFLAARYDEADPRTEGRRGGSRMGVPA